MGKALYRKHRSKSFDDVIGQEHITDTLKSAIAKDAVNHAYLFTGPRGVGKTSVARILAHAINDLDYDEDVTHLDIIEIDAASNRRIDEIRDLRDKVHITPTSARYKVYIIDEVHMLTREAFNALLKTLEEPPSHAVFILATTELHKVPDTIISRTQKFHFKALELDVIAAHLREIAKKENISVSDEALRAIARHGNGSFRDSIGMLDQLSGLGKDSFDYKDVSFLLGLPNDELIAELIRAFENNDTTAVFNTAKALKEQGVDVNQTARSVSREIREQLIQNALQVPYSVAISLLKDLLPLTNGPADFILLELCILDHMNHVTNRPTSSELTPKPEMHAQETPHSAKHTIETKKPEDNTAPVPSTVKKSTAKQQAVDSSNEADQTVSTKNDPSGSAWDALLQDIKGKHNTLYGILRMATAEPNGNEIVLTFQFDFHKKRVDSPQNKNTLSQFIKQHFGVSNYTTRVDNKKQQTATNARSHAAKESDIETVSGVFGGAELLD